MKNDYYLYESTKNNFITNIQKNFIIDKELKVLNIKDSYILPVKYIIENNIEYTKGGVVDKDGVFVKLSGRYRDKNFSKSTNSLCDSYSFDKNNVKETIENGIYCGEWMKHYGHFICESTTRLWYVLKHYKKGTKLIFISDKKPKSILKNVKIFFQLLKIDLSDILIISKITFCKNIIIPEYSHVFNDYATKEFLDPFKKISDNIKPFSKNGLSIYLSRTHLKNVRSIIGENSIERIFKNNGFKIIYPEEISLNELISYIKNAKFVAGVQGTALHNILFASSNTHLIVLNRDSNTSLKEQEIINQLINIKTSYIDANFNYLGNSPSTILMGLTKPFNNFLLDYNFKDYDTKITLKEIKKYFNEYINNLSFEKKFCSSNNLMSEIWNNILEKVYIPPKIRISTKLKKFKYYILYKITFGRLKLKFFNKYQIFKNKVK